MRHESSRHIQAWSKLGVEVTGAGAAFELRSI
jgi:hypothetical protein